MEDLLFIQEYFKIDWPDGAGQGFRYKLHLSTYDAEAELKKIDFRLLSLENSSRLLIVYLAMRDELGRGDKPQDPYGYGDYFWALWGN